MVWIQISSNKQFSRTSLDIVSRKPRLNPKVTASSIQIFAREKKTKLQTICSDILIESCEVFLVCYGIWSLFLSADDFVYRFRDLIGLGILSMLPKFRFVWYWGQKIVPCSMLSLSRGVESNC